MAAAFLLGVLDVAVAVAAAGVLLVAGWLIGDRHALRGVRRPRKPR
jgi:hypothetical protein